MLQKYELTVAHVPNVRQCARGEPSVAKYRLGASKKRSAQKILHFAKKQGTAWKIRLTTKEKTSRISRIKRSIFGQTMLTKTLSARTLPRV
jgi:hypothetical protein